MVEAVDNGGVGIGVALADLSFGAFEAAEDFGSTTE